MPRWSSSCNVLSIANGAELIISNDESVTVNGSLTNNGEITIEDISGGFFTGTFKLNATNTEGEVVTFSEGHFYKVPLGQ